MVKRKKKKETIVQAPVDSFGPCPNCGRDVTVVVDPFQVTGTGFFICVDCRIKRIQEKADAAKAQVHKKAQDVLDGTAQGLLEVDAE